MSCNNTYNSCSNIIQPVSQDCLTISLIRGDDSNILLTFFDDSSGVDVPLDLSGYDIRMEIKPVHGIGGSYLKTVDKGLSKNGNKLNISFPNTDPIFSCSVKSYNYDILFVDNGASNHWIYGNILITESITK